MELTGKLIRKLEMQSGVAKGTGKEWQKIDFIVEYQDNPSSQYPRQACFSLMNERTSQIMSFPEGSMITVSFDIDSHEYMGKWYTSLRAWKVDAAQMGGFPQQMGYGQPQQPMYGQPQQGYMQPPQYAPQQPYAQPQQQMYQQPAAQPQPMTQPPVQNNPASYDPMTNLPPQNADGMTFTDNAGTDDLPF